MSRDLYDRERNETYLNSNSTNYQEDERFPTGLKERTNEMTIGSPRARSNSTSRSSSKVRFNDNCYHSNSNPSIRVNENQDYNSHPHDGNSYQNEHTVTYRRYKSRSRSRSRSLSRSKSPIAHHPGLSYPTGDTAGPVDQTEPATHSREGVRENRNDRDDWYYNKQRGWDDRDVAYRNRDYLESNPGYRSRSHRHEDDLSPGEREYSRDYHYSRGRRKPYFDHYAGSGYHGLDRRRERDSYPSRFDSRPRFNRFRPREYRWDYGDSRGRARNRSREYSRRDHSPSPRYYGRENIQSPDSGYGRGFDPRERELDRELQLRYGDKFGRDFSRAQSRSPTRSVVKSQILARSRSQSPLSSGKSEEGALTPSPKPLSPLNNETATNGIENKFKEMSIENGSSKDGFSEARNVGNIDSQQKDDIIKVEENNLSYSRASLQDEIKSSHDSKTFVGEEITASFVSNTTPAESLNTVVESTVNNYFQAQADNQNILLHNSTQALEVSYYVQHLNMEPTESIKSEQNLHLNEPFTLSERQETYENSKTSDSPFQSNGPHWHNPPSQNDKSETLLPQPPTMIPNLHHQPINNLNPINSVNLPKNNPFRSAKPVISHPTPVRKEPLREKPRPDWTPSSNPRFGPSEHRPNTWSSAPRSSPITHGFTRGPFPRRPSRAVNRRKPDFLLEYECQLYPHPWPEEIDNEFLMRRQELVKVGRANIDISTDLARTQFELELLELEVFRLESALQTKEPKEGSDWV